jgi:hypothetical protein
LPLVIIGDEKRLLTPFYYFEETTPDLFLFFYLQNRQREKRAEKTMGLAIPLP